jgi:two-component system sensor histidine kinase DegS
MAEATPTRKRLRQMARSHHFWLTAAMLAVGGILHYGPQIRSIGHLPYVLTRHAMERVLFILPVAYAAFTFGMAGGLVALGVAMLIMLPRVVIISSSPIDALVEMLAVALVGSLISWMVEVQEREKRLRQKALADLHRSEVQLRFYLRQIIGAQEDERKRIARELHDDTAQALVILSRRLDALEGYSEQLPEPVAQSLSELLEFTDSILQGVRRFSQDLRPPVLDDLGLVPALESLTATVPQNGTRVQFTALGNRRNLSPEAELTLFRIAQEALRNVQKHAQASEVLVRVEFGDASVRMTVQDDGKGFQPPEEIGDLATIGRLGLIGMQERVQLLGGTLTLQSEPGQGTTVIVDMPM